eukprot:Transcript_16733.p4 GENE.Transcript_16733~~Transcript_16733.p4  ORF type:complete len:126 (+),score=34.48 Transcript_16733:3-380(+)
MLPSGKARAVDMGAAAAAGEMAVEVLQVADDPLMQSFHPDMPAWLTATSPMMPKSPNGGKAPKKENFSDVLKAASSAARSAARDGTGGGAPGKGGSGPPRRRRRCRLRGWRLATTRAAPTTTTPS